MRSNEGRRSRLRSAVASLAVMAVAALGIAFVRPRLTAQFKKLRATSDVYTLPSPEQTVALSLGYRSALADLIYANVLVSYGTHFDEKRRFEFVGNYLDTINALDPKFRQPYRFADTLLTIQPKSPRREDYLKAREILERGLRERPYDAELWSAAGQFLAYIAAGQFKDEKLRNEWRMAGARVLARACELVSKNENIPFHCITAASLFSRAGERAAIIQFLQRVLSVSDNEEIRRLALGYLEKVVGEQQRAELEARHKRLSDVWGKDLPFVNKDLLLVVGPPFDPAACAGGEKVDNPRCATTWEDWTVRGHSAPVR